MKKIMDLRLTPSGKISRGLFWSQNLLLAGLTLLVLMIWALVSAENFSYLGFTLGYIDDTNEEAVLKGIFLGWHTWVLAAYGVWLLATSFCMQVRRMHDVGKGAVLPAVWWVLFACSVYFTKACSTDESQAGTAGIFIIFTGIVGLVMLIYTLLGSKAAEGEEAAAPASPGALGVALAPWVLSACLYFICIDSWVEFFAGIFCEEENPALAQEHFTRSAESGNKMAKLGLLANAVTEQDPNVLPEVRRLAESGQAFAQFLLSGMYSYGYPGVEQNENEALIWLKKSADQGFKPAIDRLRQQQAPCP